MILYESDEPRWYGTQAEAKASGRPFKKREVPTDKPGLLRWLNTNLSYGSTIEPDPDHPGALRPVSRRIEPVQPDDNFEALPLAQQLHLACLALENAREKIR